jgi:hypothetical protein
MNAKLLTPLAATALAVAGVTAGHAAAGTGADPTVTYTLQFEGPTGVVNVHPHASGDVLRNPLPGDALLARSRVLDASGHHTGRTSEMCTVTVRRPATYACSIALLLTDGSQILVEGATNPSQTPWSAPVVGGTGRYAGARGTVEVTDAPGKTPAERWSFTLQ